MKKLLIYSLLASLALSAGSTAAQAQCPAASFSLAPATDLGLPASQSVRVGSSPVGVVPGLFNADSIPDLATANLLANTVTILLGVGDGTFTQAPGSPIDMGADTRPKAIASGDFDRDGRADLIVANRNSATVRVLLGQGDGTFSPRPPVGVGGSAVHVITGHFDSDDLLDAAVAASTGRVAILLGDGAGGLSQAPGSPISVGGTPVAVASGRFVGGDVLLDLAVVSSTDRTLSILSGSSTGAYTQVATFSVGRSPLVTPTSIASADLTGDGEMDLAVVNRVPRANASIPPSPFEDVEVFRGNNDGSFISIANLPAHSDPAWVTVEDLNRDGVRDLAVANAAFSFAGSVVLGSTAGDFSLPVNFPAGGNPLYIATADLDGSGAPDLVIVNQPSDSLSIYLNDCACDPSNQAPVAAGGTVSAVQGSPASLVDIATVQDADDVDGGLSVRVLSAPPGLSVTDLTNSDGTITARVAASCLVPAGSQEVVLEVTDGCRVGTGTVTVEVAPNTPPVTPADTQATVAFGSTTSQILLPLASDNGSFTASLDVTPPSFTGAASYDPLTGEVRITNAGPVGAFEAGLTLTDNCGAMSTAVYGLTVAPASTTTAILTAAPDPSLVGQPVSVTWQVQVLPPGAGEPTGMVTVGDGIESCSAPVAAGSCQLALTTAGTRLLTALYSGDDRFAASQATEDHQVDPAATRTSVIGDEPDPSVVGQAIDVSWTVDVLAPGSGEATGVVTVGDGIDSCSAPVADGSCQLTLTTAADRILTASYSGDDRFAASQATEEHQVDPAATRTSVIGDEPDPSVVGQAIDVSWTVDVLAPGSGEATGVVTVGDGIDSCSAPVADGSCQLTLTTAADRILTASYSGDDRFAASQATEDHQVDPAATQTSVIGDEPDPSVVGQAIDVSWTVDVLAPGSGEATGLVTVGDGIDSCSAPVAAGSCQLTLTTSGARLLTAGYSGDDRFMPSQAVEDHVVGAPNLAVSKTSILILDVGGNDAVNPGDRLRYTLLITNVGAAEATGAVIVDTVDPNAILICDLPATPATTAGTITGCERAAGGSLVVDLETISADGLPITVTYDTIVASLPGVNEYQLVNQAVLTADGIDEVLSDDPNIDGQDDPTVVTVTGLEPLEIPTLSAYSLALLSMLMAFLAVRKLRRQ